MTGEVSREEFDALQSQLVAANRSIAALQESLLAHTGLDWGRIGISVNSPHPNLSIDTAEFGGGVMRLDNTGMQVKTDNTLLQAIYWLERFSTTPGSVIPRAQLLGLGSTSLAKAQARLQATATSTTAASVLLQDASSTLVTLSGSNVAGAVQIQLFVDNGTGRYVAITGPLLVDAVAADYATTLSDGMVWYRTDTDKFRGRALSATDNFAMEAWVTASTLAATRGNWKVFYSDGSGVFTELALGAAGTEVLSTGTATAPAFFRQTFNVKAYGALGDNSTNDTTAIQAALDAANAAGGGTVYFPVGTYLTNKLTTYTAVNLVGDGPHASIVKLRNSQATALLTTTGFVTTDTSAGVHSFLISGISFDGNKANQASNADSGCVQIYGYNYDLRNVHIRNGKTVNLYTNWGTSAGAPGPAGQGMEARLYGVESYLAATDGIYWNGPHDSIWDAVISHENGAKGINIGARGNALKATGCHSWGTSQTYAWYIEGAALQAVNCEAEGASSKQVYIDVNDVSWIGGQVYAAGGATTGFEIANSASGYNLITKVLNCTTAAIAMTSDGGGKADLVVYGTSGSTFTGTVHADTRLSIFATGGQTPLAGKKKVIGPWYVANAGSPFTDQYFQINGGASGASVHEIAMMRSGSITGIMIRTSENRTAGTFTAEVQKNGSKIGLSAVLDGTNVTFKATTQAQGADTFAIGDVISVVWTTSGWTPTTADITCTVEIDDG